MKKGDEVTVRVEREELPGESFLGRTGCVLALNPAGDPLLKFKGRAWPIAFPRESVE